MVLRKPKRHISMKFAFRFRLFLILIVVVQLPAWASDTLTLGVYANRPKAILQQRYQLLADYLSEKLTNKRVELLVLDQSEISERLAVNQLDFLLTNPSHYILLRSQNKLTGALGTLISLEGGQATSRLGGVIITRRDMRGINDLGDLKGHKIALPTTKSLGGYQAQAFELFQAGVPLPSGAQLQVMITHDAVVTDVLAGNAEVGFVRAGVIEAMTAEGSLDPTQLRIINQQLTPDFPYRLSTQLYPEWALVALPNVDSRDVRKIASALLALDEQHPVAMAAGIGGFAPPADYLPVENIVRVLRLPPFDQVPSVTWRDIWRQYRSELLVALIAVAVILMLLVMLVRRNKALAIANQQQARQQIALQQSRNELAAAQTVAKIGSWTIEIESNIIHWSQQTYRIFGVPEDQVIEFDYFVALIHPDDRALVLDAWHAALSTGLHCVEHRILVNGLERWVYECAEFVKDEQGKPVSAIGTVLDITDQKRADEKLKLAASVFSSAREGILITNADSVIIDVNQAFTEVTGYARNEVLGKTPRVLQSGRHSPEFYSELWQELIKQGFWCGEIWNRRKDGGEYAELLNIIAVNDPDGRLQHYVAMFADITQQKQQQQQLEFIAHYDALTGLANRVLLADRLHQAMAQAKRRNQQLAVAYIDLDGFKAINDNHGHQAGDHLLIHFAERMKRVLRDGDTIARLGGDEFIAVLIDLPDYSAGLPFIQRLLEMTVEPIVIAGVELCVSGSIGISFYPQQDEVDADQLVRQADQAMYQAKQAGKNRYRIYDPEYDSIIRVQHEYLDQFYQALQKNEFRLYYQPKVNLRTGQVIGVEALLRWQHPERGLLSPMMFLPEIEDHTLSVTLGNWVLDTALAQIRTWQNQGLKLAVSINVSPQQLQQIDFVDSLKVRLGEYPDIPPQSLELEILETGALASIDRVSEVIGACHDLGVSFALDDFGTGYSTLTYLKNLPADVLKIDQSFVRNMLDDPEDLAILEGVLGLVSAFRRKAIAEGVESFEHAKLIMQLGCDLVQGYYIAKPMPAEAVNDWARLWQIDPRLPKIQQIRPEKLSTLYAMVEHRNWVRSIDNFLMGKSKSLPPLDWHSCRFGIWWNDFITNALTQSGSISAVIESRHVEVHRLTEKILAVYASGQSNEALQRMPELYELRDKLLEQMELIAQHDGFDL